MAGLADLLNGLSAIANGTVSKEDFKSSGPIATTFGDRLDNILSTVPTDLAKIPAIPFNLYNLADTGINLGSRLLTGNELHLPGSEGSRQVAESLTKPVEQFQDRLAGEKIDDRLLGNDPAQVAGAWGRLLFSSVISAPLVATKALSQAATKLQTGVKAIDAAGETALKSLEVFSPILLRQPNAATTALNVGIPAALGVGLELSFPDQVKAHVEKQAQVGTDQAISGVEEGSAAAQVAKDAVGLRTPIQAGITAPNITGDPALDWGIIGIGSALSAMSFKRNLMGRVTDRISELSGTKGILSGLNKADAAATDLTVTQGFRRNIVDEVDPIKVSYRRTLEDVKNPNAQIKADRWENYVDSNHGSAIDAKLYSVYDWGEIPGSNVKLPSIKDTIAKIGQLDDVSHAALMTGDRAAINASPTAKAVADDLHRIVEGMLDYRVEQKSMTLAERAKRASGTPDLFIDNIKTGKLESLLASTDVDNMIKKLPEFIERTVRYTEWNKVQRQFIEASKQAAALNAPHASGLFGRQNVMKPGKATADNFVWYRDATGQRRNIEVKDPLIRAALQHGPDTSRLHALSGVGAWFRRLFESGATGELAALTGSPFSFASALYASVAGTAMRSPGIAISHLDKAVQNLSGGKFGVRGDVIGNLLASAPQAGKGMMAVLAKRAADTLHSSVVTDGLLSKAMGAQAADSIAKGLTNHYKRSWVYHFQQEGLLGPAVSEGINHDSIIKTVQDRMTRGLRLPGPVAAPISAVQDTLRFVNDILHAVSASPTAAVYALNKGNDKYLVNRAIREFTGDPAKAGAFQGRLGKTVGKVTTWTPYGNVFIQSTDRFLRALSRDPIKVTGAFTTAVGIPTILATNWNASLGHEYPDYQFNKRTPTKIASSIYIGLPGLSPENGIEIPIDPWARPYKMAVELFAGHKLGLLDGTMFRPENADMREALISATRRRWTELGEGTVGRELIGQTFLPPVPPPVGAVGGILGKEVRSYIDTSSLLTKRAGFSESTSSDPTRSELLGLYASAEMEAVIRSLGANAAYQAYSMFMDARKRLDEGQSMGQALKNTVDTAKLNYKDTFREFRGTLLDGFSSISPSQEAAGQLVKAKLDKLKQLTEAFRATTDAGVPSAGYAGAKGRGFQQLPGGAITVDPADPQMATLAMMANRYNSTLSRFYEGPLKDLYQIRQSYQISTSYTPEQKRALSNEISKQIIDKNREALTLIQQFEHGVSTHLGVPVRLDKLEIGKGIDQFQR